MSHMITEAPRTHVQAEVLAHRDAFKIVRLRLPAEEQLPTHSLDRNVAIIVVAGEGRITIGDTSYSAEPGVVMEIPPGAPHGVYADAALEILVVQA